MSVCNFEVGFNNVGIFHFSVRRYMLDHKRRNHGNHRLTSYIYLIIIAFIFPTEVRVPCKVTVYLWKVRYNLFLYIKIVDVKIQQCHQELGFLILCSSIKCKLNVITTWRRKSETKILC